MQMQTIKVENPHAFSMVMGQFPFVRTINDIHETLVHRMPGIRFGLAFSDDSEPTTVRAAGTDDFLIDLAKRNIDNIAALETFVLFLDSAVPVSVMKALKEVPDIRKIYCATKNQVEIIVSEGPNGRGIMGLLGGFCPENETKIQVSRPRKGFLWRFLRAN